MCRTAAVIRTFVIACLLLLCCSIAAQATDAHSSGGARQLKSKVMPEYPELAKRINIKGSVRLELLIKPDGHVRKITVLGGNPVLAQAAVEAVHKWRYAEASAETTTVVKLDFDPGAHK